DEARGKYSRRHRPERLARGAEDEEHAMSPKLNSGIAVIGIDIGKNSFHAVGLDRRGAIVLRQKWSRGQVETRPSNLAPCLIGMESCVGAHHLSRKLTLLGSQRSADASQICAALLERAEERLPRCRGDRRGGPTPDDEVRRNQDRRAARLAGAPPRT